MRPSIFALSLGAMLVASAVAAVPPAHAGEPTVMLARDGGDWRDDGWRYRHHWRPYYRPAPPVVYVPPPPPPVYYYPYYVPPSYVPPRPAVGIWFRG